MVHTHKIIDMIEQNDSVLSILLDWTTTKLRFFQFFAQGLNQTLFSNQIFVLVVLLLNSYRRFRKFALLALFDVVLFVVANTIMKSISSLTHPSKVFAVLTPSSQCLPFKSICFRIPKIVAGQ